MRYIYIILFILILIFGFVFFFNDDDGFVLDIAGMSYSDVLNYCDVNDLKCNVNYEYSKLPKDSIISQSISNGSVINNGSVLDVVVSLGVNIDLYKSHGVNELGRVPIMMYHGIHNLSNDDTTYIGGNVDRDGYQRTVEAFRNDLEFYYNSGYRMIRLIDYVNGIIDVSFGLSPIVLTFDDGLKNNFNVIGVDDAGDLIIDPNSAVGVLEEFKNKYPDYNVTATFFLNGQLFEQEEYNDKILNWLIDHGYDIGNHSYNHVDFSKINAQESVLEIKKMYEKLESIVGNRYVNIVALPFGSPYKVEHNNFKYILNADNYSTISTLRVGWESDYSPFSKDFNKTFLKRIRAYDNNGKDFDIEYNFKMLENTRYISDGDSDLIVFPSDVKNLFNDYSTNYYCY